MKRKNYKQAFTIIEVILFLAVTGLLFIALLGGVAASVRNQRYNDSVATFKDAMQAQYNLVSNVQNVRDLGDRINCTTDSTTGAMLVASDTTKYAPGMSKCLIYGRLIEFLNSGSEYRVANVIGSDIKNFKPIDLAAKSEKEIFETVKVSVETSDGTPVSDTKQLEWGAYLRKPDSKDTALGGIMILRSPRSGTVWTYNFETARVASKGALLTDQLGYSGKRELCIASGDVGAGAVRAVVIGVSTTGTGGANSSAVQVAPLDTEINGVKPVKCNGNDM